MGRTGYWDLQDLYPSKYWETEVLAHFFTKPEPEENRYRDCEDGKLHIPHISDSVFALGITVKEYDVCCDLVLGIGYNLKLELGLVPSQILK